jgi:hypothetical protein
MHITIYSENLKERDYLNDISIDGRIILMDLKESGWKVCSGSTGPIQGPVAGSCDQDNKHSSFTRAREYLD